MDALARPAQVIESRKPANGGNPEKSYVSRLMHKGPDAFLKKIGEEATEVVMAAKDADHGASTQPLVGEVADLWFHSMIAPGPLRTQPSRCGGRAGAPRRAQWPGRKALRKAQVRAGEA